MSKLSLREIAQSQLDTTPVINGQLIVCLDTGNAYRDSSVAHVKISGDLEVVSELPLAPLANKLYYVKPDKLYGFDGANWVLLNSSSDVSLSAVLGPSGQSVDLKLLASGVEKKVVNIRGSGVSSVMPGESDDTIIINTPDPSNSLEFLTNEEIDKITGGMVDDDGNPNPVLPVTVDESLTVSGRAADAKVTGDRIKDVRTLVDSVNNGVDTIKKEIKQMKKDAVVVDAELTQEGAAADAKATGDALAGKSPIGHDHNDTYYTKTEMDSKLGEKGNSTDIDDTYLKKTDAETALAGKADVVVPHAFMIPVTDWQTDDTIPGFTNYIDITFDGMTANDIVNVNVAPISTSVAAKAQFTNTESFDGYLRLRAKNIPSEEITAQWYIVR